MIRALRMTMTPALRIAAACAALGLLADVALLVRAARSADEPRIVPLRIERVQPIVPRTGDAQPLLDSASANEPFEALGTTQTLASAGSVIPQATPMPAAQPRLIGTVVSGAESFVMMAMTDGAIKVVRVGERAGDLKLRAVSAGGAVFDDSNGGRVTLRTPTPGSEPQP